MSALRDAALDYAAGGLAVFPLLARGKAPITHNGFLDATTDAGQVRDWWTRTPTANIGAVPASVGCIALDIDTPEHDATATALGLFAEPTHVVITGNGRHVWFRHDAPDVTTLSGIIVRAGRGFVVMPPSLHPNGATYRAETTHHDAAPLPPLAVAALRATLAPLAHHQRTRATFLAERIGEGGRHAALCTVAGKLARVRLDDVLARELVHSHNVARCTPPLASADVDRIVRDIYAKERATRPVVDLSALGAASVPPTTAHTAHGRLDAVRHKFTGRRT